MIPVNEPLLDGREKEYLNACIDTGWISSDGPFVRRFETDFASFVGRKFGVAVSNGTAALETALYAAGISRNDRIVMPTFTIISCAITALRLGAFPVLVDIDPETWCMDIEDLRRTVEDEVKKDHGCLKAILPVHIYGHPVDMDPVLEIADQYNLTVIEDAAEAHGAEYYRQHRARGGLSTRRGSWEKCGCMGQIAAFSFYANKIITTGEGGMLVTDDPQMAERARSYRNLCFKPDQRFLHTEIGYNFRMTNLQAAVGVAQLERVEEFIDRKRRLGNYYRNRLSEIPGIRFQIEKPWAHSVFWMYSIEIDPNLGIDAATLRQKLAHRGVGTRPFFLGLHRQPVLQRVDLGFDAEGFPKADHAYLYGLYLPSGMSLTEAQVDKVCDSLANSLEEK